MLDPPGDLSALLRSVLIGKRPSVETLVLSCLHQEEASLLKTELRQSPSYLRRGTPATRKQLPASELLSALLRGQIGVGGRCEWTHAIAPGFSQDCTRVSSRSEKENRTAAPACTAGDPGFTRLFYPLSFFPGQNLPTTVQISLLSYHLVLRSWFLGFLTFIHSSQTRGSP